MFHRLLKAVSLVTSAALVGALLTVTSFVTPPTSSDEAAQAAPAASTFDPGLIISDAVMFDFGAMSLDDIQSFLDSKVTTCDPAASAACLKDYRADTHDIAAVANRCTGNITGAANQSAAQIIYAVARACEVNPKVLLVTLQKEQGLVTSTSPTAGKYKIAMGYGCPDTAPCDSDYFGFFNQMYQAAYAFNKYTKSPDQYTAYQPGTRKVAYNPKSSCGSATVDIKTKATGALYFYTPYVPNSAALNNPYGVGDSCSSYGNRNFWVYFNDWFGSAVGGSFLIDTADGHTYLLINGTKWEIPAARRAGLLATLKPLGTVGRVSTAYANSFPGGTALNNLVVDSAGNLSVLDAGRRYTLSGCDQAADFGFSCQTAPVLTDDMLDYFPSAGALSSFVGTTAGAKFLLGGGAKREVLDAASVATAGITLAAPSFVSDDTLASIGYGAPIVDSGALVTVRGTSDQLFITAAASYRFSSSLIAQTGLDARLGGNRGALDPASIALLAPAVSFQGLFTEPATGVAYVLTAAGKAVVANPSKWGATFPGVDPALTGLIPASGASYSAPTFIKDLTTKARFLISDGKRRPVASTKQLKSLAKTMKAKTTTVSLPGDVAALIGKPLLKPGTVVKSSKTATAWWIIDGTSKKRSITLAQAKEFTGSAKARVVSASTIAGFTTVKGGAKPGLRAAGVYYVADKGVLRAITATDAKRYGSKYGFGSWDASTIAALGHGAAIGRVIKYGSRYYEVKNSKKVHISSAAAKKLQKSTGKKIQPVSKYLASLLPTK